MLAEQNLLSLQEKKETSSSCFLLLEVLVPAKVVLQPQHNNNLTIIRSPNNSSLNEYWNS